MTHWSFVGVLSLLAFWLRTVPRYHQVFGIPGFVNFTETDAWFHVRIIQQMVRNFPHRLTVDAYGRIDGGQSVDTGIFFDAIPAFIGWITNLSDLGIHQLAAWYPAILGALLVPVTFLCGRSIFNQKAGLWAAAVVATLPGHFAVVEVKGQRLIKKRQFTSLLDAKAAARCDGCEVVSESPLSPCIDLEPVTLVESAYASSTAAARRNGTSRAQVQIYKVR